MTAPRKHGDDCLCDECYWDTDKQIARATRAQAAQARAADVAAKNAKAAEDVATAKLTAAQKWESLARQNGRGAAYLAGRGLDPIALGGDRVRYDHRGNPTLAVFNPRGLVINIARRIIDPDWDGPKVLGMKDAPSDGTLIGNLRQIRDGATVVIGEGLADALTASLAFPGCVVLFAHGGGNVPKAMAAVIPFLRANLGSVRCILVTHNDEAKVREVQGKEVTFRPGQAVRDQCLELARAARVSDLVHPLALPAKDLNDAWRAGWRWDSGAIAWDVVDGRREWHRPT